MNAIFKYPGSKWSVAKWIIDFFPEHHSYLEPFAGSLAVLMNKPRSHIETVNDLDGNVVNLFRWIRDDPEKLAHEIYFTPYARQIYGVSTSGTSLYTPTRLTFFPPGTGSSTDTRWTTQSMSSSYLHYWNIKDRYY